MKKRIFSLLLAFLMVVSMIPTPAYSVETGETTPTEPTTEPTTSATEPTDSEDKCIYCEETTAEDGTVIHSDDCNTNFFVDASADVGQTAAFSMAFGEILYSNEKPDPNFNYDATDDAYGLLQTEIDINNPPLVEIIDWHWEISGPVLWYRVKPLAGEELPEGITTDSWILQKYTDGDSTDTFILIDVSIIGKTVAIKNTTAALFASLDDAYAVENAIEADTSVLTSMVVTDLFTDGINTWYLVDAAEDAAWPEGYADYHYVNAVDVELTKQSGEPCDICGEAGCTKIHFWCDICGKYDCGKAHLYCPACGTVYCEQQHTFCGYCNGWDCGIDHSLVNKPVSAPVIPENPTLTPGADVTVVDENGNSVAEGLTLIAGTKASISAWPSAGGDAAYQWQICVDGQWINIQGQTGKGLLISPAMVLSAMEDGTAQVRCNVTVNGETKTGDAIPVTLAAPAVTADLTSGHGGSSSAATPTAEGDDDNKVNVIVNYVFTDNSIVANPWVATLPMGEAYKTTTPITVPTIPGYAPTLGEGGNASSATLNGYELTLDFSAEDLKNNCVLNIVYQPAPVKVVVNYYQQNVSDDNYTLFETVSYTDTFKTGDQVTKAQIDKTYEGFYVLLHEEPYAAADGSTVVDVYYDRYYYLMTFDLDGGYGVDAIYARYGAPITNPGDPVKPGYFLSGWTLDGNIMPPMKTMPARNTTFVAVWAAEGTTYTVIYWLQDPNSNSYSLWGSVSKDAVSGDIVSGSNDVSSQDFLSADDRNNLVYYHFNKADQDVTVAGDKTTAVNVYYDRNEYTLKFYYARSYVSNGTTYYQVATSTNGSSAKGGTVEDADWNRTSKTAPTLTGYEVKTEVIGDHTYYYFTLTARYGQDISAVWPNAPLSKFNDTTHFVSWGTHFGSGYYNYQADLASPNYNIKGVYSIMDSGLLIDAAVTADQGVNHWMVAYWENPTKYTYEIYYSLLPGDTADRQYGGVGYKKITQYTVGSTDYPSGQSPLSFEGVQYVGKDYDSNEKVDGNVIRFYYERNTHDVVFDNQYGTQTSTPVLYGSTLSAAITPPVPQYPSSLQQGTYTFEGWYTSPDCSDGTEYDGSITMPDHNLTYYAKWVPVYRTVKFYLDKGMYDARKTIPDELNVEPYNVKFKDQAVFNNSFLPGDYKPGVADNNDVSHRYKGYTFVGWFYLEDGVEKAFDPANMPVTQDLDLYGKWSSNVLCSYEIRFILDENGNGILDADESTVVADPITGSTLAGNSRTFYAKGDTALYSGYQTYYYPTVASHTIDFKAEDTKVVYTFLYTRGDPVPYTVYYVAATLKDGGTSLGTIEIGGKTYHIIAKDKVDNDNVKAVVTENFLPISGYMPDAYQKTLVVVPGSKNEIVFYYTVDTTHAFYQVNHYIQTLDGKGWIEYRSASFTGEVDMTYSASAISIPGFTFSTELTHQYNITDNINAYTNTQLPGDVSFNGVDTVSGSLTNNGMQLNLYYTRNTQQYKVQYLEYGTNEVLAEEEQKTVPYGTLVTESAITIQKDLDGDGKFEDFQLYEATDPTQSATITDDSKIFVFYYVRCTQDLTVSKTLTGEGADMQLPFNFTLTSTAEDFDDQSNGVYAYEIKSGDGSVESGYKSVTNGAITFSLKAGQAITFFDLPTAMYTVTEQELPLGYYETSAKNQQVTLTKDETKQITVSNEYAPASLEIRKSVSRVEDVADNVTEFTFYITVPAGVTGSYTYTVGTAQKEATVANGMLTISLKDGEQAVFSNLPLGQYTVREHNYTNEGYSATYMDPDGNTTDGVVTLVKGEEDFVSCTNAYPVGSLTITKTVNQFYDNDKWPGDTFTFTISRTDGTLNSASYPVYSGTEKIDDAKVGADGKLVVQISFTELGTKSIKIDNLPKGKYTVVETADADYNQSAQTIETSISPEDYAGVAEFTNTYKKHLGNLTITKTVNALNGYTAPSDAEFTFVVSGEAVKETSYTVVIDGVEAVYAVNANNNTLSVALKGGQTAVIKDLALDAYTVTEKADSRFVQVASSGVTGQILADDSAKAEFINTYVPRGNLKLTKFIDRDVYDYIEIDTTQAFAFTVTVDYPLGGQETYTAKIYNIGDSGHSLAETISLTGTTLNFNLKHNQYIVIEGLPAVGYTISEEPLNGYDTPIFDGGASGTIPSDGTTKEVVCLNPIIMVPGDLQITKIVVDESDRTSAPKDHAFEFKVTLNYITEPKDPYGVYELRYKHTDPNSPKGTLVEVKNGDTVTEYLYTPIDGEQVTLPATIQIEAGMDMEYEFNLTLYDGLTATVHKLPPSSYQVDEEDYSQDGFAASWTGNTSGMLGGAAIYGKNPVVELVCTNTYPVDMEGTLVIKKQVTKDYARDTLPTDTFTFKVTRPDGKDFADEYTVTISNVNSEDVAVTETITTLTDDYGNTYLLVTIPFTADELVMGLNDSRTKLLTIDGLPIGDYVIEETKDEDYRQTSENTTQTVTVGSNPVEATFINRYKRHLGNIQITKNLETGSKDDGTSFLFHIKDSDDTVIMSVTLKAGETITIWDLPLGTYTVTEDTSWSWRYTLKTSNDVQVTLDNKENSPVTTNVAFTNEYNASKWLTDLVEMFNTFLAPDKQSDSNNG